MYKLSEGFPTLPSAIIRIAVSDFKKVLASPRHKVEMDVWIVSLDDVCQVCLAGAVLINTLKCPDDRDRVHNHYDLLNDEVRILIYSLEDLRMGNIGGFLSYHISDLSTLPDDILQHQIDPFTYDDDGARFIEQLESLASKLENYDAL